VCLASSALAAEPLLPPGTAGFMDLPGHSANRSASSKKSKRKKKAPAPDKPEGVSVNLPSTWTAEPEIAMLPMRASERLSRLELSVLPYGAFRLPRESYSGTRDFERSVWPGVGVLYVSEPRYWRSEMFHFTYGVELLSLRRTGEVDVGTGLSSFTASQTLLLSALPVGAEWRVGERKGFAVMLGLEAAPAWAIAARTPVGESQSFPGLALRMRPRLEWKPNADSAMAWVGGFNASAERWGNKWLAGWTLAAGARF